MAEDDEYRLEVLIELPHLVRLDKDKDWSILIKPLSKLINVNHFRMSNGRSINRASGPRAIRQGWILISLNQTFIKVNKC